MHWLRPQSHFFLALFYLISRSTHPHSNHYHIHTYTSHWVLLETHIFYAALPGSLEKKQCLASRSKSDCKWDTSAEGKTLKNNPRKERSLSVCFALLDGKGFPGGTSGKESTGRFWRRKETQVRSLGSGRTWQLTSVFLPRESLRQRSPVGYSP